MENDLNKITEENKKIRRAKRRRTLLMIVGLAIIIVLITNVPNLIITTNPINNQIFETFYPFAGASPIQELYSGLGISLSPNTIRDLGTISINPSLIPLLNNSNIFQGNLTINNNLTIRENATFAKDVVISGKLYGGSPLEIGESLIISGGLTVNNLSSASCDVKTANGNLYCGIDADDRSTFNSTYDKFGYNYTGTEYCANGICRGNLQVSGNFTVIGSYTNINVTNQIINGSVIPDLNNTFDIGSSNFFIRRIYAVNLEFTNLINKIAESNLILDFATSLLNQRITDVNATVGTKADSTSLLQFANLNNSNLYNQSSASENQFGKFWINQTNSLQPLIYNYSQVSNLFNYNQSRAFNQSIELSNSYVIYWVNQTGSLMPFIYNQSQSSFDQFGRFWYNMTSTSNQSAVDLTNSYAVFWINQTKSIQDNYVRFWYNMSDNNQLLFNYNESISYQQFWYNQTGNFGYNQSYRFNQTIDLANSYINTWINQTKSLIDDFARYWRNQTADANTYSDLTFLRITENNSITHKNTSNIIYDANISCSSIVGGSDANYCADATGSGGSFSNAISNFTAIVNQDLYLSINYTGLPEENKTLIINLSSNTTKWLYNHSSLWGYNQSDNSQLKFNYNQTWNNESSSYSPIKWGYNFTLANLFNYNFTVSDLFNYNESASSWIPIRNASHLINTQISCLNITGTGSDADFCVDATGSGGSFSNAISNLTGLYNNDTYILINISGSSNGVNNQSLLLSLSNFATRWLINQTSGAVSIIEGLYGKWFTNQTTGAINILEGTYKTNWSRNYTTDTLKALPVCSGTDKYTSSASGVITCATDQTGSGSGITSEQANKTLPYVQFADMTLWGDPRAAAPIAGQGLNLPLALTQFDNIAIGNGTMILLDSNVFRNNNTQFQLFVNAWVGVAGANRNISVSVREMIGSNARKGQTTNINVLAFANFSAVGVGTKIVLGEWFNKPSWFNQTHNVSVYTQGGDGALDITFKNIQLNWRNNG